MVPKPRGGAGRGAPAAAGGRARRLENRIKDVVNRAGSDVNQEEGKNFFRLLGGYRGVSEAALAYAGAAQAINWTQWREERFS